MFYLYFFLYMQRGKNEIYMRQNFGEIAIVGLLADMYTFEEMLQQILKLCF